MANSNIFSSLFTPAVDSESTFYSDLQKKADGGFTLSFTQDAGDGNMWTVKLLWEAWG